MQPIVAVAPPPPTHAFDFDVTEQRCNMRYTHNGTASVSLSIDTQTILRLFQK